MGMDYKRAWLLIDSLNRAFETPVVERTTGGLAAAARASLRSARSCSPATVVCRTLPPSWRPTTSTRWIAAPYPTPAEDLTRTAALAPAAVLGYRYDVRP